MTTKDRIILYVYNKSNKLESEKEDIRNTLRYKPIDSLDMYEIMREDIKLQCWNEFLDELVALVVHCKNDNNYTK